MITYRRPFAGDYPITQRFGETYTDRNGHTGIDYGCPTGTPILASASGTVTYAGWKNGGYGYCVFITHPDGNVTIYEHLLSNIHAVVGEKVQQGDVIGYSGSTGNSTGPHLHFEVRDENGKAFDPMALPLMSFADAPQYTEQEKPKEHPPVEGICRIVCSAAWVRDWQNIQRSYKVREGEQVYVFPEVKYYDGLPFRFIGANRCIAEYDWEGTQILSKAE